MRRLGTSARWNGGPMALLVLGSTVDKEERRWLRVRLPERPNGTAGWIPADRAVTRLTRWRVVVDVDRRLVSLLRDGRLEPPLACRRGSTGHAHAARPVRDRRARAPTRPRRLHRKLGASPDRVLEGARQLRRRAGHDRHPRARRREPPGPARQRRVPRLRPHRQCSGRVPCPSCAGGNALSVSAEHASGLGHRPGGSATFGGPQRGVSLAFTVA